MKDSKPIVLDGRVGEGGGQLVRVAVAISALTGKPLVVNNIRGNRCLGGLKNQHVAAIECLAQATNGDVEGLRVGSKALTFIPHLPPTSLSERTINIIPGSPVASAMLILQAVLPFLLFASETEASPIKLVIRGGTHTSMSLSYDYTDQVLLPALEQHFGIRVERTLTRRGWSIGPTNRGHVAFTIHPLRIGEGLCQKDPDNRYSDSQDYVVSTIDATIIVPKTLHEEFEEALRRDLDVLFPGVQVNTRILEDSNHESRVYILIVAISDSGLRWGHDILFAIPKKGKNNKNKKVTSPWDDVSRKVTKGLFEEVSNKSQCDTHLQDQLVVFQAIAKGLTSFPQRHEPVDGLQEMLRDLSVDDSQMRKEKTLEPFGEGSLHTKTARWVAAELLPAAVFYNNGLIVEGAGVCFGNS